MKKKNTLYVPTARQLERYGKEALDNFNRRAAKVLNERVRYLNRKLGSLDAVDVGTLQIEDVLQGIEASKIAFAAPGSTAKGFSGARGGNRAFSEAYAKQLSSILRSGKTTVPELKQRRERRRRAIEREIYGVPRGSKIKPEFELTEEDLFAFDELKELVKTYGIDSDKIYESVIRPTYRAGKKLAAGDLTAFVKAWADYRSVSSERDLLKMGSDYKSIRYIEDQTGLSFEDSIEEFYGEGDYVLSAAEIRRKYKNG